MNVPRLAMRSTLVSNQYSKDGSEPSFEMKKKKHKLSRYKTKKLILPWLFLLPAFLSFGLFKWYPIIKGIVMSFQEFHFIGPTKFVELSNYVNAFHDNVFWIVWKNTSYFAILNIGVGFFIPVFLAIFLNEIRKGQTILRISYFIPTVTAMVIVAMIWKWIYEPSIGLFNVLLSTFHIGKIHWLTDARWAMPSIVIMNIWKSTGYFMLIYLAALQDIPSQLYEAAEIDGASIGQRLRYITFPQLKNTMFMVLIIEVLYSFEVFTQVFILTGGGPKRATEVIMTYVYKTAFKYFNMGYAATISIILMIFLVIVSVIQFRIVSKVKGE